MGNKEHSKARSGGWEVGSVVGVDKAKEGEL